MTNGDRIRQMSNEELAEFLSNSNTNMVIKLNGECIVNYKKSIKAYLDMETGD